MFETTRRHLFLAGFMGTGKTAIGKEVAALLGRQFIDLDAMIVAMRNMPIRDIFTSEGEHAFRAIESRALRLVAVSPGSVIALGGGTTLSPHNVKVIRGTGRTVLLRADWRTIWERVRIRLHERPLLADVAASSTADLEEFIAHASPMLDVRMPTYQAVSEFELDTSASAISESAEQITDWYMGFSR